MDAPLAVVLSGMICLLGQGTAARAAERAIDLGHGIRLNLTIVPFEASKHEVRKCPVVDWEGICLIDGRPVFGADWGMPRSVLQKATVVVAGRSVELDVSCMFNPESPPHRVKRFRASKVEGGYSVRGAFSDGAGSYVAEWLIVDDSAVRTLLRNDEH